MNRHVEESMELNLTPMIDIVFQLVIFFIFSVAMEEVNAQTVVRMAMAPSGKEEKQRDPREITVDVDKRGVITIMRQPMSYNQLRGILSKSVAAYGQSTPVIIRGDGKTKHSDVKKVLDACSSVGIWKIKFGAIKEKKAPDPS